MAEVEYSVSRERLFQALDAFVVTVEMPPDQVYEFILHVMAFFVMPAKAKAKRK